MKKVLFAFVVSIILMSCSEHNNNQNNSIMYEVAKVDTVVLYNDIVVCEVKPEYDPNDKGMCIYDIVMNMEKYPGLAREYYRELKIAEPVKKCRRITFDDCTYYYLIDDYEGGLDTLSSSELRGLYITSEQRDNFLDLLKKSN